ncbi:MAG TPA: peptide deformylase [bacterium]|nr:peptide deformylase [bacterium]
MTIKEILVCGNPRLREKSEKVAKISKSIEQLVSDMFDTLQKAKGIGLAAPQIGVLKRVIIIDLHTKDEDYTGVMINPEITKKYGEKTVMQEGCLSIPEVYCDVERPEFIDVSYMSLYGKKEKMIGVGKMLSRVIQHEVDHLNGVLFIDRLNKEERMKAAVILEKSKNIEKQKPESNL